MGTREERAVEINVVSASDLKKVKTFGKQASYAVAYFYPNSKKSTKVDRDGGLNPSWNSTLTIFVEEALIQQRQGFITVDILCQGTFGSKSIGSVRVPLTDLPKENSAPQYSAYEVHRNSGKVKGVLNLALSLGDKRTVQVQPPRGMYAGQGSNPYGNRGPYGNQGYGQQYGPQQGYYPQQQPYGYPQQQPYGYPQQGYQQGYGQQQRPRRGGGGLGGAGLGLGAGLLGGLLVGEALDNDNDYGGGDYGGGDYGGGDFGGGGDF